MQKCSNAIFTQYPIKHSCSTYSDSFNLSVCTISNLLCTLLYTFHSKFVTLSSISVCLQRFRFRLWCWFHTSTGLPATVDIIGVFFIFSCCYDSSPYRESQKQRSVPSTAISPCRRVADVAAF